VLDVNKDKQEVSLGIKQLETNPWTVAAQKYPPGTIVTARVTSLTNYGAFVEIEPGIDGLIHISDLSWTKKFNHPSEAMDKGREIKCLVLDVNEEKHRVSLGIKQLAEDPWLRAIPDKYIPGQIVKGAVTKLTNFGVFVELEPGLEGLLHISELADHKINSPQEVVSMDQELEVKILRVDTDSRKIGLSLRRVQWAAEEQKKKSQAQGEEPEAKVQPRRGGLDGALMPELAIVTTSPIKQPEAGAEPEAKPEEAQEQAQPEAEPKPEAKPEEAQEQAQPEAEPKPEPKPEAKPEEAQEQAQPEAEPEQPEAEPEPEAEQQAQQETPQVPAEESKETTDGENPASEDKQEDSQ
jgi:small subunit ribosomal protein S1